ncbi:unnamed protein product [Cochlearia groenlandica]
MRFLVMLLCFIAISFALFLNDLGFVLKKGIGETEGMKQDLYQKILRDESVDRLHELGQVSDSFTHLERTFMSPASITATNLIRRWMEDAGLSTWVDYMGNVHGRFDPKNGTTQALLIGSHMDTVIDAGKYDGSIGIISAISALKVLKVNGKLRELKRPVEVIAFSDEEGVRFQSTFLGSAALAGIMPVSRLEVTDKRFCSEKLCFFSLCIVSIITHFFNIHSISGISVQDALKENSINITEEHLTRLKYDPASVWGYVEVHIEQGPVLEWVGYPLGVVKGIAGQTRLKVTVKGTQGHAGTVPMSLRQDPMAGAAELIVLLESVCKRPKDYLSCDGQCNEETIESLTSSLVCTVGEISTWPSASNVIPGQVTFTVDLRTIDDVGRKAILHDLSTRMYQICDKRSLLCSIERKHDADAVMSDPHLSLQLKSAAQTALTKMTGEMQDEIPVLMSGAGHDAMAMSHLTKVGMLFVRCRGGISHSPEEHVLDDDVGAAGLAILEFLQSQM